MEKLAEIAALVQANKGGPAFGALSESSRLREDLGFDSFDLAELTVHVQDAFGVDVFEDSPPATLGDILRKLPR